MTLTPAQIDKLLTLVSQVQDDSLDCDGCFDQIAEFADMELAGRPLEVALQAVRTHLECCPCCADEYRALLDALEGMV